MKREPNRDRNYYGKGVHDSIDLRTEIQRRTNREVSRQNLLQWRLRLDIEPDDDGLYTESDLDILTGAVKWLQSGNRSLNRYVKQIKVFLREERERLSKIEQAETPVDVTFSVFD